VAAVRVVVADGDVVTPYGWGMEPCWQGLLSGRTAIGRLDRFVTSSFQSSNAALVPGLMPGREESMVVQMLQPLFERNGHTIPRDASLFLATTVGEIDLLERQVARGEGPADAGRLDRLLIKVMALSGVSGPGMLVSAACISSAAAVARGAAMIRSGSSDCVLVVGCDCVSEFVMSGFSSLMALAEESARPFDKDRRGLTLGEAAGFVLLMSEPRALREKKPVLAEVAGWGLTDDGHHMSSPTRDGSGLALAMQKALRSAGISGQAVGALAAHGTGTVYNDAMEMHAFQTIFGARQVPVYSIKGGTGHTLGAAGLLEMMVALRSLQEAVVPPTVNLCHVDSEAEGWVATEPCRLDGGVTVSTNSGFGGVNCALVLKNVGPR
jgi:3-oxoacyl-[acyl-carrier-protein] synthase II